ncbi:PAS domain S-box protein [Halobacteriales archaeon Cl-PHB]
MSEAAATPIRVLHVDDDPDLAEVVALHLERAHDRITVATATSAREGLDYLAGDDPVDCIVSDHDMPRMDGLDLLRAVREDHDELPFILFTGKGSEEIASEAISAGVTEYLQKETGSEQYAVLANRIERAVSERRTRAALEESERMFSTLIENLPGMVYRCANEPDWPMVYVSEGCRELTGYDAEALEEDGGIVWGEDVLHPADAEEAWKTVQDALDDGERFELTYRIVTADDEVRWIWERGSGVYEDGDLAFLEGFITDVTERRRREDQLREQRAFTEGALNALDDIFYVVDADSGELLRWNDKLTETLGYPESALAEMRGRDLVTDDHVDRLLEGKAAALETGSMAVEVDLETAEGERFPVEIRGSPMYGDEGDLLGLGGVARDISERLERERELERYRTLVENVGDPMFVLDEAGRYVMVNQAMTEQSGWSRAEFVGDRPTKFMHEDDVQRGTELVIELYEDDDQQWGTFEFVPEAGDREGDVVECMIAPLSDDGELQGAVGVIRNIQDRVERERELERYETIIQAVGDPVYALDEDATLTFVNDAFEEMSGYDRDELVGEHISTVVRDEDVDRGTAHIEAMLADPEQRAAKFEIEVHTSDGEHVPGELHLALLPVDDEFRGTAGIVRDIKERKQREERLEEFASVVSHDLRSPLNVILGRLDLARRQDDPTHLDRMADAAERMDQLIDDLLTLARKGQTVGETETVDLQTVAEGAWRTADPADATIEIAAPGTVEADPDRLHELLENLFRNAAEHAVDGDGETVAVRLGSWDGGFFVADDGPGLDPDERDDVFDHGYTTSDTGTGFGLSIVQRIAEAHGWEVEVTDGADGGARFEFLT